MTAGFERILIIGIGLIGGSLAGALKKQDSDVVIYGVDADPEAIETAREKGYIDFGVCLDEQQGCSPDNPEILGDWLTHEDIDLVVVATPVDQVAGWFQTLADVDYRGVITDTGSTKSPVIESAREYLPKGEYFIPGHPMAGSEVSGIKGARADLFDGAYWILTPNGKTDMHVFRRLHSLLTAIGARVISVDPSQHDQAVAIVSHVPHIAASSLVALAGDHAGENGELLRLAAGGFKDTTRVAAGSPDLWTGICLDNADALAGGLHEFASVITEFETLIRNRDEEKLNVLLGKAADIRRALPAKWVPQSTELTEVRIPIGDRPGVIAEITAAAGRTGCNIQAIEIDHQTENRAVLELVLTDEGDLDGFLETLTNAGFVPKVTVVGTAQ